MKELLTDMRCDVVWTDKATMPIPLYERMKEAIKQIESLTSQLKEAKEALEEIERSIPIETPDKLGFPLVKICKITLEALKAIED